MANEGNRRSQVPLSGSPQRRLVHRFAVYWVFYHLLLWHGLFLLQYLDYQQSLLAGGEPMPFTEFYGAFAWQQRGIVICVLAISPVILWDVMRLTQRVTGPLVRLERTLLRMAAGEQVEQLKFRTGDWLEGLESAFNRYLDSLHSQETQAPQLSTAPKPATQCAGESAAASPSTAGLPAALARLRQPETGAEFDPLLNDVRDLSRSLASLRDGVQQSKRDVETRP